MTEVKLIDANAFTAQYGDYYAEEGPESGFIGTVGELIAKQPTIEPEVRHGRWIVHTTWNGMFGLIHSECSECKFDRNGDLSSWKFCPNCGAKMRLRTPTEAQLDEADSVMMGGADNG